MSDIKQHFEEHAAVYLGASSQLEKIWNRRQPLFERCLDRNAPLRFLDIGGGSGILADQLLELFPQSQVTIVDLSQSLLDYNRPNDRKQLICEDAWEFLARQQGQVAYDVVNFDVLLHHILTPRSFRESRQMQAEIIRQSLQVLAPGGYISIREILYESLGMLPRSTTQRLLWYASTRRLPRFASRLLQGLGMKSQGGGVCFFSQQDLRSLLLANRLELVEWDLNRLVRLTWKYRLALVGDVTDVYVMARRPIESA